LPDSKAIYLTTGAEQVPLRSGTVDVVLARNSLDHVDDPEATLDPAAARCSSRPLALSSSRSASGASARAN